MNKIRTQESITQRTRRWLKKFPIVVRSRNDFLRARDLIFHGRQAAIIDDFPIFTPYSMGSCEALAQLTVLSVNQTFPFLIHFLQASGNTRMITEVIEAEKFCSERGSMESAGRLKAKLDEHGSDKANPNAYHFVYGSILSNPSSVDAVLEIGLGSNNSDVVSNMGRAGRPGASLRAFRDYLPNAKIYGADVDKRILFEEERIKTFFVDQTDLKSFDALGENVGTNFDLIIDDGLHSPNANIAVLAFALTRLKPGGWLVVEDINYRALPVWKVVSALIPEGFRPHLISANGPIIFATERIGVS